MNDYERQLAEGYAAHLANEAEWARQAEQQRNLQPPQSQFGSSPPIAPQCDDWPESAPQYDAPSYSGSGEGLGTLILVVLALGALQWVAESISNAVGQPGLGEALVFTGPVATAWAIYLVERWQLQALAYAAGVIVGLAAESRVAADQHGAITMAVTLAIVPFGGLLVNWLIGVLPWLSSESPRRRLIFVLVFAALAITAGLNPEP